MIGTSNIAAASSGVRTGNSMAARGAQPVDEARVLPQAGEADEALPLGVEVVLATQRHERREGLVQPHAVPPAHRDEVPEPHVGELVLDDLGDAAHLGPRRVGGVGEELGLAEGDAAEVLHRARREVRDRDEVELVAGIREREVLAVVAQRVRRDLDRERREVALARRGDDAQGDAVDVDGIGRHQGADDEGDEVGRHRDRVGEVDAARARGEVLDGGLGAVRDREHPRGGEERHAEDGLQVRLVKARKRLAGVGLLELRRGDRALVALGVDELAAVEALELVVEGAREPAREGVAPGWYRRAVPEAHERVGDVERGRERRRHRGRVGPPARRDRRLADREAVGVEDDLV